VVVGGIDSCEVAVDPTTPEVVVEEGTSAEVVVLPGACAPVVDGDGVVVPATVVVDSTAGEVVSVAGG
jgi:hypothetical protein